MYTSAFVWESCVLQLAVGRNFRFHELPMAGSTFQQGHASACRAYLSFCASLSEEDCLVSKQPLPWQLYVWHTDRLQSRLTTGCT